MNHAPKWGLQYYKKMLFKKFKYLIMNIVKYNKKFIYFKYKILEEDIIYILNI